MDGTTRLDLLIVTPSFHGAAGGAAVYYRLLADALLDHGCRVGVVSDAEEGPYPGAYFGVLPRRCGRAGQGLRGGLAYGWQNVRYLALPGIVARERPRALLVHTSFLNFPGIFPCVAGRLRAECRRLGTRLVADARDRMLPRSAGRLLNRFDAVIACSTNVARHLEAHGVERSRVVQIPVIQEKLRPDPEAADRLLAELALADAPYLFYAGLLKERKGVDLLLEAFADHLRPRWPEGRLVLAGLLKSAHAGILRRLRAPGVVHVGPRSREDVLALLSRARLAVCLSPSEGLPRASLEALALGRPVLLPPGVPEFEQHCPDFVVASRDPARVAARMLEILRSEAAPRYPIEQHEPANLLPRYLDVLGLAGTGRDARRAALPARFRSHAARKEGSP